MIVCFFVLCAEYINIIVHLIVTFICRTLTNTGKQTNQIEISAGTLPLFCSLENFGSFSKEENKKKNAFVLKTYLSKVLNWLERCLTIFFILFIFIFRTENILGHRSNTVQLHFAIAIKLVMLKLFIVHSNNATNQTAS